MCEPTQVRGQPKNGFYFDIDVTGAFDHLRQRGFADRIGVAQVLRDPYRAHAELLGALEVYERVLDEDAAAGCEAVAAQQAAQHQLRRFRTQLAVHAHVFDRDVVRELALQPDVAHDAGRIRRRRVRQQDLAAREAAQHFNWLVMSEALNQAMLLGDKAIPRPAELKRQAEAGVRVFLAAYEAKR